MPMLNRLTRWAGARSSRRLSRSMPWIGTAVALGMAGAAIRRKGVVRGVADTGLNAIPFVGAIKALVETFTGDWFRDRRRPGSR